MKKLILLFTLTSSFALASTEYICGEQVRAAVTSSKEINQATRDLATKTVEERILPTLQIQISAIKNRISEIQANGGDPSRWKVVINHDNGEKEVVDINFMEAEKILEQQYAAKDLLIDTMQTRILNDLTSGQTEKCLDKLKANQKFVDDMMMILSLGLSKALPESYLRVDVADILTGKPLGGDGALLISFRDAVLNALNISGDVGKLVKDPVHVSEDLIKDIGGGIKEGLNEICGDLCRGIGIKF